MDYFRQLFVVPCQLPSRKLILPSDDKGDVNAPPIGCSRWDRTMRFPALQMLSMEIITPGKGTNTKLYPKIHKVSFLSHLRQGNHLHNKTYLCKYRLKRPVLSMSPILQPIYG